MGDTQPLEPWHDLGGHKNAEQQPEIVQLFLLQVVTRPHPSSSVSERGQSLSCVHLSLATQIRSFNCNVSDTLKLTCLLLQQEPTKVKRLDLGFLFVNPTKRVLSFICLSCPPDVPTYNEKTWNIVVHRHPAHSSVLRSGSRYPIRGLASVGTGGGSRRADD